MQWRKRARPGASARPCKLLSLNPYSSPGPSVFSNSGSVSYRFWRRLRANDSQRSTPWDRVEFVVDPATEIPYLAPVAVCPTQDRREAYAARPVLIRGEGGEQSALSTLILARLLPQLTADGSTVEKASEALRNLGDG